MRQIVLRDAAGKVRGRKLVYDYRGTSGTSQKVSLTLKADATIRDISLAQTELIRRAENRSLKKSTSKTKFEDVCELAKKGKCHSTLSIIKTVQKELAGVIGPAWVQRYHRYIDRISDGMAVNSISNHKATIAGALNLAYRRSLIDENPLRDVEIKRVYRTRVLSVEERKRLINIMVATNSRLYWPFRFSEARPIRKSDLFNLTRDNLVLFGDYPHLRFYQQKTEKRTNRETTIPLADLPEILSYLKSLPSDFSRLFPMRDFFHQWSGLLKAADVRDFHWHDLKRIATTAMLAAGYTVDELIKLGIYASFQMIQKCYNGTQAEDILRRHAPPNVVLLSSFSEGSN